MTRRFIFLIPVLTPDVFLLDDDDGIFIGGDDVVATKSGKKTYGLDRFFSSLYGKQVPGRCFLCVSLISVKRRISYPVVMEQHDETLKDKAPETSKKKSTTTRGRPKGSQNQHRRDVELRPYLLFVQDALKRLLVLIGDRIQATSMIFDGAFGRNEARQMVRQTG